MAPAPSTSASAKPSPSETGDAPPPARQSGGDLMADARVEDLEDEVRDGPAANWEVAYVWSFVERFTALVDWKDANPDMPNVMAFEQALLDSSPAPVGGPRTSSRVKAKPITAVAHRAALASGGKKNGRAASPASSLSSLEDDEPDAEETAAVLAATSEPIDPVPPVFPAETPVPEASQLLRDIFDVFQSNLKGIKELNDYHGKKTWFHFLINFVSNRFTHDPVYRNGFRWETNLLRTKGLKPGQETEKKFWMLRWEDKIHLMRILVDFQLINAAPVRDLIKDNYDLGNQRIAKRDPDSNGLVVLPAGRTSTHLTLYHLDSSPRLYASCDPYKDNSAWICVCSTLKGYKAFLKTLAEPSKADKKAQALRGPFAKAAAGKKLKGKEVKEDKKAEERVTRARLEADLEEILEYEEAMEALEQRKARAAERAATRDARVARTLQRLSYTGTSTRSSRLRARGDTSRVTYGEDDAEDGGDAEGDDYEEDEPQQGRRKRRRANAAGDEASEAGDGESVGGSSRRSSVRPSIPGERRSNRLQLRDQQDDEEDGTPAAAMEEGGAEEGANGAKEEDAEQADGAAPNTVPATPAEGDAAEEKPDVAAPVANGDGEDAKPMEVDDGVSLLLWLEHFGIRQAGKELAEEKLSVRLQTLRVYTRPGHLPGTGAVRRVGFPERVTVKFEKNGQHNHADFDVVEMIPSLVFDYPQSTWLEEIRELRGRPLPLPLSILSRPLILLRIFDLLLAVPFRRGMTPSAEQVVAQHLTTLPLTTRAPDAPVPLAILLRDLRVLFECDEEIERRYENPHAGVAHERISTLDTVRKRAAREEAAREGEWFLDDGEWELAARDARECMEFTMWITRVRAEGVKMTLFLEEPEVARAHARMEHGWAREERLAGFERMVGGSAEEEEAAAIEQLARRNVRVWRKALGWFHHFLETAVEGHAAVPAQALTSHSLGKHAPALAFQPQPRRRM
ncbi:hypothetical protein JCM10450v2_003376 [Rhodotorula kratochvilovae]